MKRLISYNVFEGDPNLIAEGQILVIRDSVSINGVVGTSIKTYKGATVNWVVSKTGYKTQRGTEVVTTNTTKAITLEANPN